MKFKANAECDPKLTLVEFRAQDHSDGNPALEPRFLFYPYIAYKYKILCI